MFSRPADSTDPGPVALIRPRDSWKKRSNSIPNIRKPTPPLHGSTPQDARRGPVEDRGAALRTALENAEKAYELNKDDYFSYWTLGVVHSHMRNTEKAAEFFQKALDLNPNAAEIYTFMVRIHLRREDPPSRVEAARTAIRLNPVHPPAMRPYSVWH